MFPGDSLLNRTVKWADIEQNWSLMGASHNGEVQSPFMGLKLAVCVKYFWGLEILFGFYVEKMLPSGLLGLFGFQL